MKRKFLILLSGVAAGITAYLLYKNGKEIDNIAKNIVSSYDSIKYDGEEDEDEIYD